MRVQNIILVISSLLSFTIAAPVAELDSSAIVARNVEIEAREQIVNRAPEARFYQSWPREAEAEAEPFRRPPTWRREAEAEPEAYPPSWKREAEAEPEPYTPSWRREAEAEPEPIRPPSWKREAEAGPPAWKREAEAEPYHRTPSWKRNPGPPDW